MTGSFCKWFSIPATEGNDYFDAELYTLNDGTVKVAIRRYTDYFGNMMITADNKHLFHVASKWDFCLDHLLAIYKVLPDIFKYAIPPPGSIKRWFSGGGGGLRGDTVAPIMDFDLTPIKQLQQQINDLHRMKCRDSMQMYRLIKQQDEDLRKIYELQETVRVLSKPDNTPLATVYEEVVSPVILPTTTTNHSPSTTSSNYSDIKTTDMDM